MAQLTPISLEQFATKGWKQTTGYSFAAKNNFLPVVAQELSKLVPAMPLAFVKSDEGFLLVALTSLLPNTNLYVAPDGSWLGIYTPAALRGYPFQMAKVQDKDEIVLCVHEDSGQIVEAPQGNPIFDENGALTQVVKSIMDFLIQVEQNRIVTQLAVDSLDAAGLIAPWSLNVKNADATTAIEGLYRIDEAAMNALSDEDFLSIRRSGALPIIYSQLLSMNQLGMFEQLNKIQANLKAKTAPVKNTSFDAKGFTLSGDESAIKFS